VSSLPSLRGIASRAYSTTSPTVERPRSVTVRFALVHVPEIEVRTEASGSYNPKLWMGVVMRKAAYPSV